MNSVYPDKLLPVFQSKVGKELASAVFMAWGNCHMGHVPDDFGDAMAYASYQFGGIPVTQECLTEYCVAKGWISEP